MASIELTADGGPTPNPAGGRRAQPLDGPVLARHVCGVDQAKLVGEDPRTGALAYEFRHAGGAGGAGGA